MFNHSVVLETVYRQDPKEKQFLGLLEEFALGECSNKSLKFIKDELSEKELNCQDFGIPFVPHIFCTNFDVTFFNLSQRDKMPGEKYIYTSIDTCNDEILNKVTLAEKHLVLKIGAEVILLYNISSKLTNGTRGQVIQLEEDGPTVNFYNVGITCKLTRVSWFTYESGSSCDVIGQRNQYPLKLAWGITVHKSQGQTLQAAYVHSGREFVAGQLYVAASRVSSPEGLSILQFNPASLIKANNRVVDFYKKVSLSELLLDHQCCRNKIVDIQPTVVDFQFIDDPLFDEPLSSSDLAEIDAFCQTYFVSSVDSECEAGQVDEGVEVDEGGSSSCHKDHPDVMDNDRIHSFLEELKDTSTQASVSGSLASKINNLITSLQQPESLSKEVNKNIKNKKDGSTSYDFKSIMATEFSILNMEQLDSEFSAVIGSKNFNLEHHCVKTS